MPPYIAMVFFYEHTKDTEKFLQSETDFLIDILIKNEHNRNTLT